MKKFLVAIMFGMMSLAAQAEASFDQIQGLIQQGQYQAAEQGLEVIIKNHPQSAKAFYAMAQAQAGLGNLDKAKKALDIATGLNPSLDFAPASSVASLREAITPQTKKIEAVETSHFWSNFAYFALFAGFAVACYFLYSVYARKQEEEAEASRAETKRKLDEAREEINRHHKELEAKAEAEREALRQHKNYSNERFDPTNPDVLLPKKSKAQLKAEADALALREAQARAEKAEAEARAARSYSAPQPTTTVVNNSGNDMLTGVLIGNMISNVGGHHHDNERVVTREVVREVPAPSRDSSWDEAPAKSSSRSSSWDDTPSTPSRSSSWDSDSDTKSSSSWSSSSSSSSSSWDSGSSDSSSSSSWD